MRVILVLLALLLPGAAHAEPWRITEGKDIARIYSLPGDFIQRVYYSPQAKTFTVDLKTQNPAARYYTVMAGQAQGQWSSALPAPASSLLPVPPYGEAMTLDSQIQRVSGPQNVDQPYGDHKATLMISEKTYTLNSTSSGRYGATAGYQQTLGRGKAIFKIADDRLVTQFSFAEHYDRNSRHYTLHWTPDGQFVLMVPPDQPAALLIAGPFPTDAPPVALDAALKDVRAADEARRDDEFVSGESPADRRYWPLFDQTVKALLTCTDVLNKIGKPDILALRSLFDAPYVVEEGDSLGQYFRLQFTSDQARGEIAIAAPLTRVAVGRKGDYRDFFNTVTIRTEKETLYALCP